MIVNQVGVMVVYQNMASTVYTAGTMVLHQNPVNQVIKTGVLVLHQNQNSSLYQVGLKVLQNLYPDRIPSDLGQIGIRVIYDKTINAYKVITVSGVQS